MAINDFFPDNSTDDRQEEIGKSYLSAKRYFSENIPYRLFPSPVSRDAKIVIFSQHFITVFRMMLSSPDSGCIVQMSEREREVYYSFLDYQDGETISDPEMLLVVTELNNCIVNEIECKTETYLKMCFNEEYTWDSEAIDVDALAKTVKMTQVAYNDMVADGEVVSTTTYIITLDNVAVKIYIGEVEIWTA